MRRFCLFLVAAPVVFGCRAQAASVHIWMDTVTLPTYRAGPADPIPHYAILPGENPAYPYASRTEFTSDRRPHSWRSLNLENEYLFCRVLPDLGGHLYNCRDKRNNREVFYANPVIKPQAIGLRTSWVATGIESNFPLGHSFVSTSPVDFAIQSDPDGSARAVVEETDHITGMKWRVEFILRPASALVEQRVLLYNGGVGRRPYYWWANAGVALDDANTRVVLPASVVTLHSTPLELLAWPLHPDGKDGTVVANIKSAAGWFAYGCREPFFGVYKPGSRSGLVHAADPTIVMGKKIWVWGTEGDKYVQTDLTDNFPSYIEMQGGVFPDQTIFGYLEPQQAKSFSEYWIPVFDTDGITRATKAALLYAERRNGALVFQLSVPQPVKGATIRVLSGGGATVFETQADLSPASTYAHSIEKPIAEPYVIQLLDSQKNVLLEHTEGRFDAVPADRLKLGKFPERDWNAGPETEQFLLEKGEFNELNRHDFFALSGYAKGMSRFPESVPLKKAAGRLDVALDRFEEAAKLLTAVHAADPGDEETMYYLGAALSELGQDDLARATLTRLKPGSPFAQAAALPLVRIAARAKEYAGALAMLQPLLAEPGSPASFAAIEVALLRNGGRAEEEAARKLTAALAADPASSLLRYERTLAGAADPDLWTHLAADSERVLSIAGEYLSLGLFQDALRFLEHPLPPVAAEEIEPGAVPTASSPLIAYYRAYCRTRLGQDGGGDLKRAAAGFRPYVFPWRPTTLAVLHSAIQQAPQDAVAYFLLGRLYMQRFMPDQGMQEWQKARELNPKLPGLHLELATALAVLKKDPAAGAWMAQEGLAIDPQNSELRKLAAKVHQQSGAIQR